MIELQRASAFDRQRIEEFQRAAYARTEAIVGARAIPLEWDYGQVLEECEVWLDESGGSLRGVLILRIRQDDVFLESIATAPEASGSGRARLLMDATFERARELRLNRVGLITNSLNPALAWYKRMGFMVDLEEVQPKRSVIHMSMPVPDA
ncbi:GNAT family N-acetyltransferase [Hoeflea alexandrii]|uniref:GNAT family N-acetyltransferase n=1 Tax=Hoeflea alexandrii TaxID=288436 RepID=UPI0022AFB4E9|nr:GNAT family N-acetyltransferase [Hoeflea alexandrii]MCZ4291857.1 GNAT family N-acetyltransferase [Hoeflea alexandrii]